ncbi:carbohydrate-binding family 6 protein [candidate division KSB1 bacterium]|nr:carbohydrate-binding family 6 protein [candidate division KSB1 bacterium]
MPGYLFYKKIKQYFFSKGYEPRIFTDETQWLKIWLRLKAAPTVSLFSLCFLTSAQAEGAHIYFDKNSPQVEFAVTEIKSVLESSEINQSDLQSYAHTDGVQIILCDLNAETMLEKLTELGKNPGDLQPEGFSLRKTQNTIWVIGADAAGTMYGGLELAEIFQTSGLEAVADVDHNPYMSMRGIKFNIPLDVRTPSYSDVSDAAQHNIAEMWSFDFWREFIDNLARYRYNFISCWNLHPFPSLVHVPDYPDVALDDVQRSTVCWEEHYDLEGTGFDAPEILGHVEILKKMTIDEKIEFWRQVMAYGKSRNIDFYFITWNIFTNGTNGKYGITDEINNPITRDYFRHSVKQMFLTYPDLKGIGLTTGENMYGASFQEKEDWAFETYAQGVLDAAAAQPGRKITLIHRQHMAGALDIAEKFKPVIDHPDIEFIFSFKYAKAHVYSSTTQTYHTAFVEDIQGKGDLKTIWTLRNDDIYFFRWGSPDFVRDFIQNIPHEVSRGYYYGSDQYIWGREFLMQEPESPRQLEIVKHWYQWMLWGRLGYDPGTSNERFTRILHARFPGVDALKLFTAWQEASMIYPTTTGFHWGALDFQWYIEACQSRPGPAQTPSGFHDVNRFITLPPHPGTRNISIENYVKEQLRGKKVDGISPIKVADRLHAHADQALSLLNSLYFNGDKELRLTFDDIRCMAWLGKYYAHKIHAATELALFRETLVAEHQHSVIEQLQQAAHYWRCYASLALSNYRNPLWTNRVGHVDWRDTFEYVLYDITTVGGDIDIPSMKPTRGGVLLEAESTTTAGFETFSEVKAYTGAGYIEFDRDKGNRRLELSYDAPVGGRYILEFRYINSWNRRTPLRLVIHGKAAVDLMLWNTGSSETWAWDRVAVDFIEGTNKLTLSAGGRIKMDHVNILYAGEK